MNEINPKDALKVELYESLYACKNGITSEKIDLSPYEVALEIYKAWGGDSVAILNALVTINTEKGYVTPN